MDPYGLMTFESLEMSLADDFPPEGLNGPLKAHWYAAKGDRKGALETLRDDTSQAAAWVRAHLHSRNGEEREADEWYARAGREPSRDDVDRECRDVATGLFLNVP